MGTAELLGKPDKIPGGGGGGWGLPFGGQKFPARERSNIPRRFMLQCTVIGVMMRRLCGFFSP